MSAPSTTALDPDLPAHYQLLNLDLMAFTEIQLIERVVGSFPAGTGGWLVNPNLDCLRLYMRDDEVRALIDQATLVVGDSIPLYWAARVQGVSISERVAGSDLIWTLSRAAATAGVPVFLLGGRDDAVAQQAAATLAAEAPGLRIGSYSPPFGFDQSEAGLMAVEDELRRFGPAIVFCALGFPKQERLASRLAPAFPDSWFVGSGASVDFVAGHISRAPEWMQRTGLEWTHRLWSEPGRLWRRYLVHDLPFAFTLFGSAIRRRVASSLRRGRRHT